MQRHDRVAALVLAAGESRRFGSPKQLAQLEGRTLLEHVLELARAAELRPVVAVVPVWLTLPGSMAGAADLVWLRNPDPERGMSHSLRLGLAAVPPEASAAVLLLGDQPRIPQGHLHALVAARGPRPVVATRHAGVLMPPVLLERSQFGISERVTGDRGLRDLLRADPDLVTAVDVAEPLDDVDDPADLERMTSSDEPCPGCGERYAPVAEDTTHEYIGASPACWATFGELLAREFGDYRYGVVHRHTIDAYAAQHPGTDGRRQRQSVALHLVALCHWLEEGMTAEQLNPITQRLAGGDRAWPWLEPPTSYGTTVRDVLRATTADEHVALVRAWAEDVWRAWSRHHATVRAWAAEGRSVR